VQRLCLCLPPPTGSGTGVSDTLLHTLSKPVLETLAWKSKYSSSGAQLVSVVFSSPTSSFLKPRACLLNKLMSCTTTELSLGDQLTGYLNLTIGSRNAGKVLSQILRGRNILWIRLSEKMERRRMLATSSKTHTLIVSNTPHSLVNLSLFLLSVGSNVFF